MSTKKATSLAGVPGVPLAALDAIEDENTRIVVRAIVDGWNVRNGNAGKPENRFITLNELGSVENLVVGLRGKVTAIEDEQRQTLRASEINRLINDVQGQIMESLLWQELGTRIDNIDLAIVAEQQARIAAVQAEANARIASANQLAADIAEVAADLVDEATARLNFDNTAGSQILTLQQTTATQATQITGLQTRTTAAENTIVTLQQTTATQATQITGLTTRTTNAENSIVTLQQTTATQATALTNLTSRVDTAESSITTLQQTTATQATLITSLTTRVNTAESNITTLQTTTGNQATSITSLTTRMDGAESNISSQGGRLTTAESNITTLQSTTATTATNLTSLTTRVGTAETNIGTLQTTTANQATQLNIVSATANNKAKVFYQASAPTSVDNGYQLAVNDMWLDSDDNNRLYRWNGSSWAESSDARIAANAAAITTETTARINGDNAITNSVTTQFSTVNNNIAALQQADTTITNSVASLSSTVTTLQATVGANTSAIQTEATTRANADNDLYAKYSVKIDQNGYVSGFGLMSTANNAAPSSTFIVRADSFAVGSPSGPGITPAVPFVVKTTPSTNPDGSTIPVGVYMGSAYVKELSGVYIYAGMLEAGKIYTGSQYIDIVSKYPVLATPGITVMGYGAWSPSAATNYVEAFTTNLRLYAPDWHHMVPINQRVRHMNPGEELRVTIIATSVVDYFLSVWYRIRSYITANDWPAYTAANFPNIVYKDWFPYFSWVTEPRPSNGPITISVNVPFHLNDDQYIEFTIAPTAYNYGANSPSGPPETWSNPDNWFPINTSATVYIDSSVTLVASNL
jgi:multidrug resistance efflux pump